MGRIEFEPWEPEETVGKLWHGLASRFAPPPGHAGEGVALAEVRGRLAVLFRGLGGAGSVEIRAVGEERSRHRLSFLRRLAEEAERVPVASFDGAALRLPETLAVFPAREANAALYLWLAACAAHAGPAPLPATDPLAADLAALEAAGAMIRATLAAAPGLAGLWRDLGGATLALRPRTALPAAEAAVEARIRALLGDPGPCPAPPARAPRGYRPFRPVPLWPDLRPLARSEAGAVESRETEGAPEEGTGEEKTHRARRRSADQAERPDSFILHKFEAILSWAEFLNLNRRIEDDDGEDAKKAADDHDEIGLGQVSKAPAARLKLHLDLAPEDAAREALSGVLTYPEWDVRAGAYLPAHVRVLTSRIEAGKAPPPRDPRSEARIRAVRRRFEALRPGRLRETGQPDGEELDTERAVRALADLRATGEGTERVWARTRPLARSLAVSILLDISRSTESAVPGHGHEGRTVIGIEREALTALARGLQATGDDFAIHAFSSLRRDRVWLREAKAFGEPMGPAVEARIAALRPGHYTRLGAAVRHCTALLSDRARARRLLLVITDGKPNDLDHYEGRHGIEDSRMAVREARRAGHAVFGVTVDRDGKAWFPRIFGAGGYALVPDPDRLTDALPLIWQSLTGQ